MKVTIEDVLKSLPDFEDLMKLSSEISTLMYNRMVKESEIKSDESKVFEIASTDAKYFINGKQPSTTYIENTWRYRGFSGELIKKRLELAEIIAKLEQKKLQMDIYKSMLDVWRTLSANSRSANI